jgi:hypothetical protein
MKNAAFWAVRRVALVRINVSEVHMAYIIRVETIRELENVNNN